MSDEICLVTEDQVLAYVTGDVDEPEAADLARHLGECRACRDQAVEFRVLEDCLGEESSEDALGWTTFTSPFGTMCVAATRRGLAWVSWRDRDEDSLVGALERRFAGVPVVRDPGRLDEWKTQLEEYFRRERTSFDLPVDLRSLTDFERSVLEAAREIPYGEVVPYGEVARRIDRPRASRAVGNALGHNPVAIVVPCHRVVRSDGSLGGYTGGEEYKRRLLAIEGRLDLLLAG